MRFLFFIFVILLTASGLYANELTVKDLYGRTVIIPGKVNRTLALGPGALRLLVYVGAQDTVAGREMFEDKLEKTLRPYTFALPKNYSSLPVVSAGGPGKMPDAEKIIMINPDVIFTSAFTPDQIEDIARMTHKPVIGLNYGAVGHTDLEKVMSSIRLVGYVTGHQKRAQDVMNRIAMMRKDLMSRTSGQPSKSVYMASIAYKGARDFNSTERDHPSCALVGVTNLADSVTKESGMGTHIMLQTETILKDQPDYIFYDITGFRILKNSYKKKYQLLRLFNAVRDGHVYSVMPYNWYNSNLENIFLTAYFIGKTVYPKQFKDVNINQKADEIYNAFLGMNPFPQILKKNRVYRRVIFEKNGFSFRK